MSNYPSGCPECRCSWEDLQLADQAPGSARQATHIEVCASANSVLLAASSTSGQVSARPAPLRLDTKPKCSECQQQAPSDAEQQHATVCPHAQPKEQEQQHQTYAQAEPTRTSERTGAAHRRNLSSSSTSYSSSSPEFSPQGIAGLFPMLRALLEKAHGASNTRLSHSVLCSPFACHSTVGLSDAGYGCGYRCFQMLFASARHMQQYASLFGPEAEESGVPLDSVPSIRRIQSIIEAAWSQGYDPPGKDHFDGHLQGRRKWIGTTELYVAFTFLGIHVHIVDVPQHHSHPSSSSQTPAAAHKRLVQWIDRYFSADHGDAQGDRPPKTPDTPRKRSLGGESHQQYHHHENAFSAMMQTQGRSCTQGSRQPLFLQHNGHSRVVVGIEHGKKEEDTCLLIFDPSIKTRPKVRRAAEEAAVSSNALAPADTSKRLKSSETTASESSSSSSSSSSNAAPPPPLQRRSSRHRQRASWWSRNFKSESAASDLADHHALLGVYRVSVHKLSRKSEYQILHVDNRSPALTPQQRLARRVPVSQRA